MKYKLDMAEKMAIMVIVILVFGGPACWIVKSYFEARAYNRLTGAHATTWDAMWVELRVQEKPK